MRPESNDKTKGMANQLARGEGIREHNRRARASLDGGAMGGQFGSASFPLLWPGAAGETGAAEEADAALETWKKSCSKQLAADDRLQRTYIYIYIYVYIYIYIHTQKPPQRGHTRIPSIEVT